ncbi:MAG: PH domain-containing protein [Planctomycetaceae bacterium]|nr:PH domain-containing protein [Planctomycetaceae bacterium]
MTPGSFDWLLWLSVAALLVNALLILVWFVQSVSTTLTLTDSRTILRNGLISRESSEVQHDDVRNIQVNQTFFQRMLRIGDIGISSSGQDDLEIQINGIPNPGRIVKTIRENQR